MSTTKPVIHDQLPRVTPEEAGISSATVSRWVTALTENNLRPHAFILLKDGRVFAEGYYAPYAPLRPQTVYSLSKSFTSVAVGMAAADGVLDLDEKLADIFPDRLPDNPGPEVLAITVRDCLKMATGQPKEPDFGAPDLISAFLAMPFSEMPGQVFRYNTAATYMCSAVLAQRGVDLEEFLEKRLLGPLGIDGLRWMRSRQGICTGGFGFSLIPELIAKFGQLILQQGEWQGRQLIPKDYLALATAKQIETVNPDAANADRQGNWALGYGYQFWQTRDHSFRGDGMYGQYCAVTPEKGLVLAMTAFTDQMQLELDLYFDHIAAAFPVGPTKPLAADPTAYAALQKQLADLAVSAPDLPDTGLAPDPHFLNRTWKMDKPMHVSIFSPFGGRNVRLTEQDGTLVLKAGKAALTVKRCQHQVTTIARSGIATWPNDILGAWSTPSPDTLRLHLFWLETLVDLELDLVLADGKMQMIVRDVHGPAAKEAFRTDLSAAERS